MNWPLMKDTITWVDRARMMAFVATASKFTNGQKVKDFESSWNGWLGSKHSLFVSSGSTANFLLVAAVKEKFGLKTEDKVLLPGCTWMTNVSPVMQLGFKPIFCDINLQNYSFDVENARRISKKHKDIKAIFVSHLLGFSGENDKMKDIFPNSIIIDDICESHGCLDKNGNKMGHDSLGATFSFYFGHHMTTIEGGIVSTSDEEMYDLMKMKRSHGLSRESTKSEFYAKINPEIDSSFLFVTDGYNFRNHEICAVLGLSQLPRLDSMIERRRKNYDRYVSIINDRQDLFYPHEYEKTNSSFCFPFVCRDLETTSKLKKSFAQNQIEHRPIVGGNLLKHPFLKGHKVCGKKKTNLDILQSNGVYIGNNHFVGESEMDLLSDIIKEII